MPALAARVAAPSPRLRRGRAPGVAPARRAPPPRRPLRATAALSADPSAFRFEGTRRLYGDDGLAALADAHVVVLGMGGVGSWTAEALARVGVGALTLVDLDHVCVTNVNRQVLALDSSVGAPKADVMAARVADINPECVVRVVNDFITRDNVESILGLRGGDPVARAADYVVDAVDSERDKAAVVACCVRHGLPVLVTGGAGGIDALTDIVVEDLSRAAFNRLLQRVRRVLRRDYSFPAGGDPRFVGKKAEGGGKKKTKGGKFGVPAVYARENANRFVEAGTKGRGGIGCDGVGGSAVFVTGALGFRAASHVAVALVETARERERERATLESRGNRGDEERERGTGGRGTGGLDGARMPGRAATTGWRSRVWPPERSKGMRAKTPSGGDSGTSDAPASSTAADDGGGGGGGGGGGSSGGGGDGRDGGDGEGERGEAREASSEGLSAAAAFGAFALRDDERGIRDSSDSPASSNAASGGGAAAEISAGASAARVSSVSSPSNGPLSPPPALPASAIFDAHCHWHLDASAASATAALSRRLAGAAFTSTEPPDWPAAELAAADSERARGGPNASRPPGFGLALGLHPWWAHLHPLPEEEEDDDKNVRLASSAAWLPRLRARLEALPGAIVGEIGLDRASVPLDPSTGRPLAAETLSPEAYYANQRRCFAAQLSLAADLRRPCAVHCVRAYGDVGEAFRLAESFPPRVLMHSYGGSGAFAEGLVRMKADGGRRGRSVYFGFSAVVNLRGGGKGGGGVGGGGSRKDPKAAEAIRRVPADRLLVESDLVSPAEAEAGLREMLAFVAETRGWTLEDAARITRENAERFYGPVDESDAEQV